MGMSVGEVVGCAVTVTVIVTDTVTVTATVTETVIVTVNSCGTQSMNQRLSTSWKSRNRSRSGSYWHRRCIGGGGGCGVVVGRWFI